MSEKKGFGSGWVRFVVAHPFWMLLIGILLVAASVPGGRFIRADFSYRVWFNDDDPLIKQFDAFERRFGNDELAMFLVHSPSGVFDDETASLLREVTRKAWLIPEVIRVTSLSNFNWVRSELEKECWDECIAEEGADKVECKDECEQLLISELIPDPKEEPWSAELLAERQKAALEDPLLPNYLVSKDGKTAMLYATLRPAFTQDDAGDVVMKEVVHAEVVKGFDDIVAGLEDKGDHEFYQAGTSVLNLGFQTAAGEDMKNLIPLVLGLTAFFLLVIFRRVSGVLLPFVVIILSVVMSVTTMGWLDLPFTSTTAMLPQILIAIAVADSVHLLHSYFHALGLGLPRREAALHSLHKNFVPTLLTSVTTSLGFFSFANAAVVPIGNLGILAGIGAFYAWLVTYTVLGPLMVVLPIKPRKVDALGDVHAVSDRARRISRAIVRNRIPVLITFVLITIAAAGLAATAEVNSDPYDYFPEDSEVNRGTNFMKKELGGALPVEIVLNSGKEGGFKDPAWLAKAALFQRWVAEKDFVSTTVSIVDILKSMNKSIHGDDPDKYVLPDTTEKIAQLKFLYEQGLPQGMNINDRVPIQEDAIRITAQWTMTESKRVLAEIDAMVAEGQKRGLDTEITGKGQLWQRMNPYVVDTFVTSLVIAIFAMTLLLIIVFRDWKLGLLAMIPNGVPLIAGGAMLAVAGHALDVGTVIVFSVCLGIAVDDTIHFLANYNAERKSGKTATEAVEAVLSHTMPALMTTTAILVTGFGTFILATFTPNQWFGILVAFVLTFALITDAFLLPALLANRDSAKSAPSPAE